jgi:hypothetical protein
MEVELFHRLRGCAGLLRSDVMMVLQQSSLTAMETDGKDISSSGIVALVAQFPATRSPVCTITPSGQN